MGFMRMKMKHRRRFFQIGLGSVGLLKLATFLLARPYDEGRSVRGGNGRGGESLEWALGWDF